MKFQWYIINCDEGTVEGTNDVDAARPYIEDDSYVVLTAQHGMYYLGSTKENQVQELDTSDSEPAEGDPES